MSNTSPPRLVRATVICIIAGALSLAALIFATGVLSGLIVLPPTHDNTGTALGGYVFALVFGGIQYLEFRNARQIRRLISVENLLAVWPVSQNEVDAWLRSRNVRAHIRAETAWIGRTGVCVGSTFYSWSPKRIRLFRLNTAELPYRLEVKIDLPAGVFFIGLFASYSHRAPHLSIFVPSDFHHEPAAIAAAIGVTLTFNPPAETV